MQFEDDRPRSIGSLLELLTPRVVYDVALLEEEFGQFGFRYDRATDRLEYLGRCEVVGSQSAADIRSSMDDGAGGTLADDLPGDIRLVDATDISRAVFALMFPDRTPPGCLFADRDDEYAANLAAIVSGLTTATWVTEPD